MLSYWDDTAGIAEFPRLDTTISVDVAIIGGGIVGVSTGRFLKDMGRTVAVIEARRVGRQVTGKSTAKVTSQHHLIYQTLEGKFGEAHARQYADAQQFGVDSIRNFSSRHQLDCDWEDKPAFVYACDDRQAGMLDKEAGVTKRLGLPSRLVGNPGLPFSVSCALRYDSQAQFHPIKYVAGLAKTIPGEGCHVFEESRAVDWNPTQVSTDGGTVNARCVVMATHLPLGIIGGFFAEAYPYAEPVVAARTTRVPDGMFISADKPSRSIRTHRSGNGDVYAIAAGGSFKPGRLEDLRQNFDELERWLADHFEHGGIEYRWVNHDYSSMDSAPFIGWSSSSGDRYLVATGFSAWGISNGTAAGKILADLATNEENPWLDLFDARRVKPLAGGATFIKENAATAGHLVGAYFARRGSSLQQLKPGDAAILNINGKQVAAYRDHQGVPHTLSAACSHMGCVVGWNEVDRTWDCPCHGSRFTSDGRVIHGPATQPLASLDLTETVAAE